MIKGETMPRHARQLAESGVYHVIMRGTNRDVIFLEDADYESFLKALATTRTLSGCRVLAYCLMNTHIHLVLRTTTEPVGAVVKRLGVRYAGWFNHKYGRVGHVFQDRFRSRPVENDAYLVTLVRYVWNNPVEAGLVPRAEDYRWSSRRLLGSTTAVVDDAELRDLMADVDRLEADAAAPEMRAGAPRGGGPKSRFRDDEGLELLCSAGGIDSGGQLRQLPRVRQRLVIAELRSRGMPYAQIARLTGFSVGFVHKLHTDGRTPPPERRS